MESHDLIIVGAGAAGLTAGIFAARRGLNTLIISKDLGGQASTTPDIENYPGLDLLEGLDLMKKFESQAKTVGARIKYEEVKEIKKSGDLFVITTPHFEHQATAVILAFGKTPSDLNVPGEAKFKGEHIHYAALRSADEYHNKTVAIIGGANTAAQAAITLAGVAKKVTLLCREATMRCEKILLDRLLAKADIVEIIYNCAVKSFNGDTKLDTITVEIDGHEKKIEADDCFIGVGYSNKTDWVKELVATDKIGQIIIEPDCSTSTPGIFAAGDVTTIPYKQVVISAGEGAKAAIAANYYIAKQSGRSAVTIDWGAVK